MITLLSWFWAWLTNGRGCRRWQFKQALAACVPNHIGQYDANFDYCCRVLPEVEDRRWLSLLIEALTCKHPNVRELAANALRKVFANNPGCADRFAVMSLVLTLRDEKIDVRNAAARALGWASSNLDFVRPELWVAAREEPDTETRQQMVLAWCEATKRLDYPYLSFEELFDMHAILVKTISMEATSGVGRVGVGSTLTVTMAKIICAACSCSPREGREALAPIVWWLFRRLCVITNPHVGRPSADRVSALEGMLAAMVMWDWARVVPADEPSPPTEDASGMTEAHAGG